VQYSSKGNFLNQTSSDTYQAAFVISTTADLTKNLIKSYKLTTDAPISGIISKNMMVFSTTTKAILVSG
jgi:predicted amidophosphoribosyltransferase